MFEISVLKINSIEKPFCLESPYLFSWCFKQGTDSIQKSYRLLVSSSSAHQGDYWDSGEIKSNEMSGVVYEGNDLPSRSKIFVKLVAISQNNEVSEITNSFETTLKDEEWHGKWTSIPNNFAGGTALFRKILPLKDKPIKKARAYIAGLGYYEFYVNAKKIGDSVLNPGVTNYAKTILYDAYDFTPYLEQGKPNVVGIELGYGWHGSRKNLVQFYIEYEDGEELDDFSNCGNGWWVSGSPTIENSIYGGETYDARLEEKTAPHWCSRDFEPAWDNGWMYTILIQPEVGKKVLQQIPPIRVSNIYKGEVIKRFDQKDLVFDLKQNIAGWARIKVKGERGSLIKLYFAEGLDKNGHANQLNLRSAKCLDQYILKGEGIEEWAPRFTYHGFQYVEVLIEGNAEIIELSGEHVHSDNVQTGFFRCSDEIINKLHHMAFITEQNNQHSIFTDCPQRDERFGWLNDLTARIFQQTYNFDCSLMYRKVENDIKETANELGQIGDTAPFYTGGQPADTTTVSYLLLPYYAYVFYGDKDIVRKYYDDNKKWVEYLLTRQKDFVMDYYYYADWVRPETLPDTNPDSFFISSMFLYWHLDTISKLAEIIGNEEDFKKYKGLALQSKNALNKKYYHKEGYYSLNNQCENAMAVNLGICEEENKGKVVEHIVKDILDKNKHLTCGNQGYRHAFYLLCEYGYIDLALDVLRNKEYPGWGFMVACGASTVWERWEQEMFNIMDSFDHPMFGSYDAIFYRYLGGIQIDGVAADKVTIHPCVPTSIDFVESSFESIRGKFVSNWKKHENYIEFNIVIPANTTAKIVLDYDEIYLGEEKISSNFVAKSGSYNLKVMRK